MSQLKLNSGLFALVSVLFLSTSIVQAKKYIVTMNDPKAFDLIYNSLVDDLSQTSPHERGKLEDCESLSVLRGAQSLKNLGVFIVNSNDNITSLLQNCSIVFSVKEETWIPTLRDPMTMNFRGLNGDLEIGLTNMVTPSETQDQTSSPQVSTGPVTWGQRAVGVEGAWENHRGEGVKVMVIDSGIYKDHPEFKNRLYQAKNFITDEMVSKSGFSIPTLPYDYYDEVGHGSHVAGTIAGNSVGVAPESLLVVAKACIISGCLHSAILEALEWGVEMGVDIINMSFGAPVSTSGPVYASLYRAGVLLVGASGNSGFSSLDYPAAFPDVIAVGAVDEKLLRADFSQFGQDLDIVAPGVNVKSSIPPTVVTKMKRPDDAGWQDLTGLLASGSILTESSFEADLVDMGLGLESEVTEAVEDKIALIGRGEIPFREKVIHAMSKGAMAVVIYNNELGFVRPQLDHGEGGLDIPVIFIPKDLGEELKKDLDEGGAIRLSIERNLYLNTDGTSMAAPHIAGVLALIKSANPHLKPDEVKEILLSTATSLAPDNLEQEEIFEWGDKFNKTMEYGFGLVNAEKAVKEAIRRRIQASTAKRDVDALKDGP